MNENGSRDGIGLGTILLAGAGMFGLYYMFKNAENSNAGTKNIKETALETKNEKFDTKEEQCYFEVNLRTKDFTILELVRELKEGKIQLSLENKRKNNIWSKTKRSELIESILMGIPIPPIYASQDEFGRLNIMDGKERVQCVRDFLDNKFKLTGLRQLQLHKGNFFANLDGFNKTQIEDFKFTFHIVLPPTPESVKYEIFRKVGAGGSTMTKQEMRNTLYKGKVTEILDKMCALSEFQKALDITKDMRREKRDKELALGFLSFYLLKSEKLKSNFKINRDDFFAKAMKEISKDDFKFDFDVFLLNFEKMMKFAERFDGKLFKFAAKNDSKKQTRKGQTPLFESLGFALMRFVELEKEFPNKKAIEIFKNKLFEKEQISSKKDDEFRVNIRFKLAQNLVEGKLL